MELLSKSTFLEYANGNFGASNFLGQLRFFETEKQKVIYDKLAICKSLRGTNIWVLFSDLCNKDLDKVHLLCANCPDDILEDACSRQDYSGRELVKEFL